MRYITTKNLKEGLQVGKPITTEKGMILLNVNGVITSKVIQSIKSLGLQGCYINDDVTTDIYINDIIPEELKAFLMAALMHQKVEDLIGGAKILISNIKNADFKESSLIEVKDLHQYTLRHSVATAIFSAFLGEKLGLNENSLLNLCLAALLMDVGKMNMSENEAGNALYHSSAIYEYGTAEREYIRQHARRSYEIIQDDILLSAHTKNAVLFSHEYLDGSGYYGYSGKEIKILPRILHIAEIYDALTSERRFRAAYSPAEAIEYIMGEAAKGKLDMEICQLFKNTFPAYGIGQTVYLDNGKEAVITSLSKSTLRPIVRVLDTRENVDLLEQLNITITGIV